jgi:thiol-disulfide isomerase/thioredoxin
MKKSVLVVATVIVLIGATYWANRRWPGTTPFATPTAKLPSAPNVVFKDLQGNEMPLAQYKGKVVLVNFWATWCEPCRFEIPWLIEYQKKYADRGFTILGVAMDVEGKSVVEPFVQQQRFDVNGQKEAMNYPIVLGNDPLADAFGATVGLPTSVLISRDGKKVKTILGMILNPQELDKQIESLLQQ